MKESKKYYWLKLKEDFFDEKYIKALRKLPDGDALTIVYLKMQLKSLKTEGIIQYEHILPSAEEELALVLDEDVNIVRLTLSAIVGMGLAEKWENDTLYMVAMQNLIGSETAVAERVRKHRQIKAETQKVLQCNTDVTKCNTYIDIEKREKRKDIEIEKDKEIDNNIIVSKENDSMLSTKLTPRDYIEEFEQVWKEYPRKQGKANACKAYIKARRKGVDKQTILEGVFRYVDYITLEKTAEKYVKQGSTWFNQECWNDDYTIKRKLTTKDIAIDISDF